MEDNQDGSFVPGLPGGELRIERSTFRSNGPMPGSTPSGGDGPRPAAGGA
jgi:hypothetical protein